MDEDWSRYFRGVANKSDEQLQVEANMPDKFGGNAQMRAVATIEIKKRDGEIADALVDRQLKVSEQQAKAAWLAVWAAWGGAFATFAAAAAAIFQAVHH